MWNGYAVRKLGESMKQNTWFIARRMYYSESESRRMARPAVRVALAAIAVGMAVMVTAIFVVIGFKHEVRQKVAGFGSHLQIVNFDSNNTHNLSPVIVSDSLLDVINHIEGVRFAEPFVTKPGIIKTSDTFQAIVLKGHPLPSTGNRRFWDFFAENIVKGSLPASPQEVILSASNARRLRLDVDSSFLCYFIQDRVRVRKYTISGLYETGLQEADDMFVIGDLKDAQRLQEWDSLHVSGVDIIIEDFDRIEEVYDRLYMRVANRFDDTGNAYYLQNIIDQNPAVFSWLDLLDTNVVVIILLMLAVAGFNIISGLIILILSSIELIGLLKALGAEDRYIRNIFLIEASILIGEGVLIGNAIGLLLCALQYWLHIVPLDPVSYYVSYVPISFEWGWWLLLNVGTIAVSLLILIAPSRIITRISPAEIMRYE